MPVEVKICGVTDTAAVAAAVEHGARYVGLNFFPPSPRALKPAPAARLAAQVPTGISKVGVFVDPDDGLLSTVLDAAPFDLLQLHGDEPPDRCAAVRARFDVPVMKAIKVGTREDLASVAAYEDVADFLMFDARPPASATRPGGNAVPFDWSLLEGRNWLKPWFLAGGITADNVAAAVVASGARLVDVSSGVERAPGHKDPAKIKAFLDIARRL